MQVFHSRAIVAPLPHRPVSARTIRLWSAPEVILAFTNLMDEPVLLPHIISQARRSSAKIILAHVHSAATRTCRKPSSARPASNREAREALDRMARQLRWLGFICEPVLLSGQPELEIPLLVRSCDVGRVLFGFEEDRDLTTAKIPSLDEQILRMVDVPICAIGRNAIHANSVAIRDVTLAISSESRCEIPLSFACRLAQELRARLTVLHVAEQNSAAVKAPTPQDLIARLPFTAWREAELFCPTQVTIRAGNPADEILNHCMQSEQGLIVMCSPGDTRSIGSWRNGVSYRTITGARCPVIVAKCSSDAAAVAIRVPGAASSQKFSPQGERLNHSEEAMM
jgi:nucleotide-binding universal stress UspA family protein